MVVTLEGCVIALSGKFEEAHAEIASLIKSNGGKHSTKIDDGVTHLVATVNEVEKENAKVKQTGGFPNIKLVNYDWLMTSITNKLKSDESTFQFATKAAETNSKGKKRARSETPVKVNPIAHESPDGPPAKKQKDGNKAKSSSLRIPLDETCNAPGFRVYIGDDGTIYDAALNQTNAGNNNNKFYRIQLLESLAGGYKTWTRWGRVGELGANKMLGEGSLSTAMRAFDQKFKDKTGLKWENRFNPTPSHYQGSKYTFIERKYEDDSSDEEDELSGAGPGIGSRQGTGIRSPIKRAESTLPKPVQRLMELIFNKGYFADTMTEMNYDADKLPLGQLSKRTLQRGLEALKQLGELFANPALADEQHTLTYGDAVEAISNSYYTIIPHIFGRQRPPVIHDDERLMKEIALLESLSDMEIANTIMKDTAGDSSINALDRQFAGLGLQEMAPLEITSHEYKHLQEYLIKSHGATHDVSFKVQDIFRIQRDGEFERFDNSPLTKTDSSDRRLLWHGSRCTNFGGILSQGLRIAPPEAPVSGYAFGKGVYFADISSKSANYCHHHTSGDTGLLLLCEVELGKPMLELDIGFTTPDAATQAKQRGRIATWGKGATGPAGWKDASCVNENLTGVMMPDTRKEPGPTNYSTGYLQYNEFIVYDIAQVKMRYLLRVEMR